MNRHLFFSLIITICFSIEVYSQSSDYNAHRRELFNGVEKIGKDGVPGPLVLTKESAFPLVTASIGENISNTVIAGSTMGQGRVIAFGHPSFFTNKVISKYNSGKLLLNSVFWTARNQNPRVAIRDWGDLASYLSSNGVSVTKVGNDLISTDYLRNYDVLIIDPERLRDMEILPIKEFVKNGKGLLVCGLGWGWKQLNRGKSLMFDMKANQLIEESGIMWGDGYLYEESYTVNNNVSPYLNFHNAIKYVRSNSLSSSNRSTYGQALSTVMSNLPFIENVSPFTIDQKFPGKVSNTETTTVKTVSINTQIPRWHSTGLYAPPGKTVQVKVDNRIIKKGYKIRIGAHSDQNYNLKSWKRHPDITLSYPIEKSVSKVFNPFGGLIYIEVPSNQQIGSVDVTISDAVNAPLFVLNETNLNEWKNQIRNYPAPWAELAGKEMIITVQSEKIRNLDNPAEIIRFWDQAQVNNRKLASWKEGVDRPMRIVFDIEIALGYMHSGYPIMSYITNVGEQEYILDPQGDHWGFYHELGHNHQSPLWTFDGTGEVTCNLFTLYNIFHLQKKPRLIGDNQDSQKHMVQEYFNSGSPFDKWKAEPFLALHMYDQLIEVYGWQVLESIFQKYTQLRKEEHPKTNQEKMDLWFTMYSNEVGKNLTNFFDKWGMPISLQAKQSVSHLPEANLEKLLANMAIEVVAKPEGVIERFRCDSGFFIKRKVGNKIEWVEQNKEGADAFFFKQYNEDDTYFYLSKNGANMNIRVPKKRGWLQWNMQGETNWNNLYLTTPF